MSQQQIQINAGKCPSYLFLPLFFFAASFCGWLWEVAVFWVQHFTEYSLWNLFFTYRGVLHGPWAPIYGAGALLMLVLHRYVRKHPALYFGACMAVSAVIEYITSLVLETVFHAKWWDYTGYFLNINGRICAMSLIFFTLAGMAVTYLFAPLFRRVLEKFSRYILEAVSILLTVLFTLDTFMSLAAPNLGLGVQVMT